MDAQSRPDLILDPRSVPETPAAEIAMDPDGSADPRNMLYHEGLIYIIDFDNARPSRRAEQIDYVDLEYWYGLRPGDAGNGGGTQSGGLVSKPYGSETRRSGSRLVG